MDFRFLSDSALFFDGGGDFEIVNGDLKVIKGSLNVRIQSLKDLLRSNLNDYFLLPQMCANLNSFEGRGIDKTLQTEIESHIQRVIIDFDLFSIDEFKVYSIVDKNTIVFRIVITDAEDEIIQVTYSTSSGVTIG